MKKDTRDIAWIFSDLPYEDDLGSLRRLASEFSIRGARGSIWALSLTPSVLKGYEERWAALHDINLKVKIFIFM